MKVLDLFSGLNGWSQPFKDRWHDVITCDIDPRFNADYQLDVRVLAETELFDHWKPDIVLASPPCTHFTVMRIGTNWTKDHKPKTKEAAEAWELVRFTIELIDWLEPRFWIIENPRAKMRRLMEIDYPDVRRETVTYCQYQEARMKPTDLWGVFPPGLVLKPTCRNNDTCHTRAVRGSRTATQGMDPARSALIPYALALDVCLAAEADGLL